MIGELKQGESHKNLEVIAFYYIRIWNIIILYLHVDIVQMLHKIVY